MERHKAPEPIRQDRWILHPVTLTILIGIIFLLTVFTVVRFMGSPSNGIQSGNTDEEVKGRSVQSSSSDLNDSTADEQRENNLVVVYISGAVKESKIVKLPVDSRVIDAIEAAGGVASDAIVDDLNFARKLTDGEHIHVTSVGDKETNSRSPGMDDRANDGSTKTSCVDINLATAEELQSLDGIGPNLAERIVLHREQYGVLSSPESLLEVSGIGSRKLAGFRDKLCD